MRHLEIVEHWYNVINERFPEFSEQVKKDLAIVIYDELDYIRMLGTLRPGGLFEKLKIPLPKSKPSGVINGDFLKYL